MTARNVRFCLITAMALGVVSFGAMEAVANEPLNSIPQDVFDGMLTSFRADVAKGVHARYQWKLSGPNGGEWWLQVNDGTFRMGKGTIAHPDVTFRTSDKDWVALSNGTLPGFWAYLTGRLNIRGDQGLAKELGRIFP